MIHSCDKPCGNKTASGYCATTACINPQYSNFGTAQYGQGVQKRIVTNADKIRQMSDEELAELCEDGCIPPERGKESWEKRCWGSEDEFPTPKEMCCKCWLDWLKQEAET